MNIPADGTSSATLVVTARRKSGRALPGLQVRLSGDGCRVTPAEVVSDANGRAVFTVTTPPEATGIRTLSASVTYGDFKAPLPMSAQVNFFAPAPGSSNGVAPGDESGIGVVTNPDYTGTVHFVSSDPDATLPADYTFTASDLGVKVFIAGVILRTPGIQTVSAIDVATGKVLAVETFFVVLPEVAGSDVLRLVGVPTVLAAGTPASFSVDAQDGNGVARTSYTGLVAFSCTDPRAQIPPAHNFVAAEGGHRAFDSALVLETAGAQTFTVTDGHATTRALITVSPSSPAALQVTTAPSVQAGEASSVSVRVVDSFGNPLPNFAGMAHLSSTDPHAVLPADLFFSTDADSRATLADVILTGAGAQTITVGIAGTPVQSSAAVAVVAATAATMTLSGLSGSLALSCANDVTVTLRDVYGNLATGYVGTVGLTVSDAQASLPPPYTFTAADAGTHTFAAGVIFNTLGTQWLIAQDAAVSDLRAQQNGIRVHPALPYFQVSLAASVSAGAPQSVFVVAHNPDGSLITDYSGTVHVSSTDSAAVLPDD